MLSNNYNLNNIVLVFHYKNQINIDFYSSQINSLSETSYFNYSSFFGRNKKFPYNSNNKKTRVERNGIRINIKCLNSFFFNYLILYCNRSYNKFVFLSIMRFPNRRELVELNDKGLKDGLESEIIVTKQRKANLVIRETTKIIGNHSTMPYMLKPALNGIKIRSKIILFK